MTRANVIVKLGQAINNQFGGNYTEPLVYELVTILDPENDIFKETWFVKMAGKESL